MPNSARRQTNKQHVKDVNLQLVTDIGAARHARRCNLTKLFAIPRPIRDARKGEQEREREGPLFECAEADEAAEGAHLVLVSVVSRYI